MPIDGLVSGLKTSSIIESLMAVERAPQDALVASRTKVQRTLDAYASVRDKLTAVGTAATALATTDRWNLRTASSTNSSVATVTASSTASVGSLSFTVDTLAGAHGVRSGNVIAGLGTVIASGGNVTIDTGAGPQNIAVGGGSLNEVVAGVNSSNAGVRAVAVNTGSGYRLQLNATTTGAASTFTVGGLDASVGGTVATSLGSDATLTIGSGPGAYSVTSTSNTFADVVPGMSITAVSVSAAAAPVTVSVAEDVTAIAKNVKTLITAANAALMEISTRTAYNPETKAAASLNGDSTVRRAVQELTRALSNAVTSSSLGSAKRVGISLERTGRFTFDEAAFTSAYTADPAAVRSMFTQNGSTTGSVSFTGAGARATPGSYDVVVTQAAEKATATGPAAALPAASDSTIGVRIGSTTVNYTVVNGQSAADAVAGLQAAITAAGLGVAVTTDGSSLSLASSFHGSSATFDVAWDGSTWDPHQGVDVAGTIGGAAATGVGLQLTVPSTDPKVAGLSVKVTGATLGNVGAVTYDAGLAQRAASSISSATDLVSGYLTSAETSRKQRKDQLQTSIDGYEVRLTARQKNLKTYWAALEVSLSNLQSQSSTLSSQISGLSA